MKHCRYVVANTKHCFSGTVAASLSSGPSAGLRWDQPDYFLRLDKKIAHADEATMISNVLLEIGEHIRSCSVSEP